MKTFLPLTTLASFGIILLSSCQTVDGPAPSRRSNAAAKTTAREQSTMPQSYYKTNAEGRYYYTTDAEKQTNADYRPTVRRNYSSGGSY